MMPILYCADEKTFNTNGIGVLSDTIDCTVTEILNSSYEMELKYPVTGIHFSQIQQRSIIVAKPDPITAPQPFRVYRITKPMNGTVTVYARHIVYDLMGITVIPFWAPDAIIAMETIKDKTTTDCPFVFSTDIEDPIEITVDKPQAIWTLMGSDKGGILNTYGGEYFFDGYNIRLCCTRGENRGVSVRYGKNLTSLEQDENCAGCYTAVHPYWLNSEGQLIQLSERIVKAPGNHGYTRVMPLDLSKEFNFAPTEDQLREAAEAYINENGIGIPTVSWKVQFVQLEQTEEYRGKALLERVLLGDTVTVQYTELGVSATARAVEVRYKPILERYDSVTLGNVKASLAETIVNQSKQIAKIPSQSQMQIAIKLLTSTILGARGGAVRLLDTDGDEVPDTLYIADNPDPDKAVKVWRFNYEGWAGSKSGYNGPFVTGVTFDSGMVGNSITAGTINAELIEVINLNASNIKTGHMNAEYIKAGKLLSQSGLTYFDLDSGEFSSASLDGDRAIIGDGYIELKDSNGNRRFYAKHFPDGLTDVYICGSDGVAAMGFSVTSRGDTYLLAKNLDHGGYVANRIGWKLNEAGTRQELTRY